MVFTSKLLVCDRCDPPHNRYAAPRRSCRVGRQGHGDHMWGAGRDRAHLGAVAWGRAGRMVIISPIWFTLW
jgi:hypothetical protein